ncbi:hypothetical protein B0H13DRAFT_2015711 [Mycena leptocephala]|nr:hypothetical protein B0H13DRAFT_2015711 [Mycena leptocephala]
MQFSVLTLSVVLFAATQISAQTGEDFACTCNTNGVIFGSVTSICCPFQFNGTVCFFPAPGPVAERDFANCCTELHQGSLCAFV